MSSPLTTSPENEPFGLFWPGRQQSTRSAFEPTSRSLRPCPARSVRWDRTQHMLIEGDNLEALKLLRPTHAGAIKLIYIDPPYNTGKPGIYLDRYREKGGVGQPGSRRHAGWLNMIWPRLLLARELLAEDGALCISIDDTELANLRLISDEIFGNDGFVACLVNINNPKGRSDDRFFPRAHEYVLVYQKGALRLRGAIPGEHVLRRYNKLAPDQRRYREIDLRKTGDNDRREDRPNLFYYFHHHPETGALRPSREAFVPADWVLIKPLRRNGTEGNWRWEFDTAARRLQDLEPKFMPIRKVWTVMEKDWLRPDERIKPTTAWAFKDINSERATEQFTALGFDKQIFPKPKPLGLIRRLLDLVIDPQKEEMVLDFFAGSGTTGHAVYQFNADLDGRTRFLLVQAAEATRRIGTRGQSRESHAWRAGYATIAEITAERLRRAGALVRAADTGFRLYQVEGAC